MAREAQGARHHARRHRRLVTTAAQGWRNKNGRPLKANGSVGAVASVGALKLAVTTGVIASTRRCPCLGPSPARDPQHWSPRAGTPVPHSDGGRSHLPGMGLPPRLRAAHRRAGRPAVAQRRPRAPEGPRGRVRRRPALRRPAVGGQEPRRRAHRGSRRRPRPGPAGPAQAPGRGTPATDGYEETDYVFTREGGGQYHPMNLSRLLANLSTEVGLPRLTAHGLRHTRHSDWPAHAGQGHRRAPGPRRPDALHQPVQHVTETMER